MQRCLVFVLFVHVMGTNGASLDLKINIEMNQPDQIQNGHFVQTRQVQKPRIKKHFLSFDPELDYVADSPDVQTKIELPSRSSIEGDLDPDYPYEKIQNYLKTNPHLLKYFPPMIPDLGNRGGGEEDEGEDLCRLSRELYYSPQKLKNTRGMLKTIINDDKNKQFLQKETCVSDKSDKCNSYKILGYTSKCVQKFQKVRLVTFSDDVTEDTPIDEFLIPSCCMCKLKMDP